jgi:hypothetical protein
MNEKDHQTAMRIAQLSESVGMLFIPAGVVACCEPQPPIA